MKSGKVLLTFKEAEFFDRAVRDRAIALVTLHDDQAGWRTFKCRFLERDPNMRFFVLDYPPQDGDAPPSLALGQYVGVSFRYSSRKIMLSTIVEAKGRYLTTDNQDIPAVRYRWPQAVTELQRRAFYRTPIPGGMALVAHIWSGGIVRRAAAQGATLQVHSGQLVDVSCGGALIRLNATAAPHWSESDNLGLEIQLGDGRTPVQLDAQFRGARQDEQGRPCVAVQFIGLEMSVDGRVVIQRIAQAVQRLHRLRDPVARN